MITGFFDERHAEVKLNDPNTTVVVKVGTVQFTIQRTWKTHKRDDVPCETIIVEACDLTTGQPIWPGAITVPLMGELS